MKDRFQMRGKLHYVLRDKYGNIKKEETLNNTVTNYMDKHVADQLSEQDEAAIGFMAVGSGTGAGPGSTNLVNFVAIIPLSGNTPTQQTGNDDNDVLYSAFFSGGVATNDSISEAGVFQVSGTNPGSTLCLYNDGLSVNKGADDTLKIDWTLTLGSSLV